MVALPTERARQRLIFLAAAVGTSLPVIAGTVRAVHDGWVPIGDRAIIAVRAYDVFGSHSPLVGQYSASSHVLGHTLYSLGPLLYWLLALPVRLNSPAALTITAGALNVAAAAGIVVLARRRGGETLMIGTAIAVALMCSSLSAETFHDIWNPSAAVLPFTLLAFLCWSLACGEYRLLPVTVLVASFVVQCQLTYLLPSLGLLAVAMVGLWLSRRGTAAAGVRRWAVLAVAVALVCWSAPLLDQVFHAPGNLVRVARTGTAGESTLGATVGARAVVRAIGVPPWWLRAAGDPFGRAGEVRVAAHTVGVLTAVLVLAAVVAVAVLAVRRRRVELASAAAISLVLCAALWSVAAGTPTRHSLVSSLGYTLWWGSPAGMWVWLMLAYSALALLPHRPVGPFALPAGAVAAIGVAVAIVASARADQDLARYHEVSSVIDRVDAVPIRAKTVRVEGSPAYLFTNFDFKAAIIYSLRRRGIHVVSSGAAPRLGSSYEPRSGSYQAEILVDASGAPLGAGQREIARSSATVAPGVVRTVTVRLAE